MRQYETKRRLRVKFEQPQRIEYLDDGKTAVLVPLIGQIFARDSDDAPELELVVDVRDGRTVVTELTMRAADGIASDALRNYSVAKLASHVLNRGVLVEEEPGRYVARQTAEGASAVLGSLRRRERPDEHRLQEVAELHAQGGAHAVRKGLAVSRSQAYRLIALARELGILEGDK